MYLRDLESKDASRMLEWMRHKKTSLFFQFDAQSAGEESVRAFIDAARAGKGDRHFAVSDNDGLYLGTVSLKNIDNKNLSAEYAISLCHDAFGTGAAAFATGEILKKAFDDFGLERVFLNVLSDNARAIRFYRKFGFIYEGESRYYLNIGGRFRDVMWFRILRGEYLSLCSASRKSCHLHSFTPHTDSRGTLVGIEGSGDVPFDIKRVFYTYGMLPDSPRGAHANRNSKFVIVCLSGKVTIRAHNGVGEEVFLLDTPEKSLYIPEMIWKDIYASSPDCLLLTLSDRHYDADEYIRDFNDFLKHTRAKAE
jgi:diamine N-acetyltransferase